jgi:hypothetical protein
MTVPQRYICHGRMVGPKDPAGGEHVDSRWHRVVIPIQGPTVPCSRRQTRHLRLLASNTEPTFLSLFAVGLPLCPREADCAVVRRARPMQIAQFAFGQEAPFARSCTRTFVRPLRLESGPLPVCGERRDGPNSPGWRSRLPRLPVHGVICQRSAGYVALRAAPTHPVPAGSHTQ